jgi:predicted nucleotidyltransferase
MITPEQIDVLTARLVAEFRPRKVILFGSQASGHAREGSDVDILLVLDFEGHPIDKALEILKRVSPPFSVDLIVRRPEEVRWRYRLGDTLMHEAIGHGRVLYEAAA